METTADTDAGSTAAQDFPRIPLDMDAIAAQAQAPKLRRWRVEWSFDGSAWVWTGNAATESEAIRKARIELDEQNSMFCGERAFLHACIEVAA